MITLRFVGKMDLFSYIVLTIVLLLVDVGSCSGGITNILYVTPVANVSCPGKPCLTISQYAQNSKTFLKTNSKLIFLQGHHTLSKNLTIQEGENFTMLTLEGQLQQSKIHFGELVKFAIFGLYSLKIESLLFLENSNLFIGGCRIVFVLSVYFSGTGYSFEDIDNLKATNLTVSSKSVIPSVLLNIRASSAQLSKLYVLNNSGNSIVSVDQSSVQFRDVIFKNNAAVAKSSLILIRSTATFEGGNQFHMNSCEESGGAMSLVNSTVTFYHQVELTNNGAKVSGGAFHSIFSSVTFNGILTATNNCVFQQFTTQFGGFLNSLWSNITINGTALLQDNYIDSFTLCLGGAISARMSTIVLTGSVEFRGNYAKSLLSHGGAVSLVNSKLVAVSIRFLFLNNTASTGGAIALVGTEVNYNEFVNNTLHISGVSVFEANKATNLGGAMSADGTFTIYFTGNTTLMKGNATVYGSHMAFVLCAESHASFNGRTELKDGYSQSTMVQVSEDVRVAFSGITIIRNNTVLDHSGVLTTSNGASYSFIGHTIFHGNKGIALVLPQYSSPNNPLLVGEGVFFENDGGISLLNSTISLEGDLKFMHNYGPCITISQSNNVTINGTIAIESNVADSGPAISSYSSMVYLYGDNIFNDNCAKDDGGSLYLIDSHIYMYADQKFISNSAKRGGAVYAINSHVYLTGDLIFMHNNAESGGVFALGVYSVIHFDHVNTNFTKNTAKEGGVIYLEDIFNSIDCSDNSAVPVPQAISVRPKCFYNTVKSSDVSVVHRDNVATDRGNILFGGNLRRCNNRYAFFDFKHLFGFQKTVQVQNISSKPYQISLCDNSTFTLSTLPGKLFSVSVRGLDQLLHTIPSVIRAELPVQSNYTSRLGKFQSKQIANGSCTSLNYRVYSQAPTVELILYAEGPCNKYGTASVSMTVQLGDCPDGFQLESDKCICAKDLLKYTSVCIIDDESILNNGTFWAGGLYDNGSYVGLMSFSHCPFDYCIQSAHYFTLRDSDLQCAQNRSGIMCGQCRVNHSLTLGGSGCMVCPTNPTLTFALLLLFALFGVGLVVVLTLLRLTVAFGTLNGLIFYANIVGLNKDIFKIEGWANVFISWLNLDFGFAVCFYHGMGTYAHTWMQFIFPFYIWMLIGIIIVTSHYSTWMTRRLGSNPVAVLATLILLSYTKFLQTIVTVFSYANLGVPLEQTRIVWFYDGNIAYLRGKHLPLFTFAMAFFVFAFIPYTLLLLLGPWLQKIPSEKYNDSRCKTWTRRLLVGWYNDHRIQSFMEAYTAPYNSGYQYWTGMFLILRCVLFLVFSSNSLGDPSINLLAISTVILTTLAVTRLLKRRVYKTWWVDLLEVVFLLNLGVLSVGTFHTLSHGGNQVVLSFMSVGSSAVLLITIMIFHVTKQITGTNMYNIIVQKLKRKPDLTPITSDCPEQNEIQPFTTSYVPPLPYSCTP